MQLIPRSLLNLHLIYELFGESTPRIKVCLSLYLLLCFDWRHYKLWGVSFLLRWHSHVEMSTKIFVFFCKNISQNVFYFSPKCYKISIFRLVRAHIPSLQNFNENVFDPTLLLYNCRLLFIAGQKRVANPPPSPPSPWPVLPLQHCKFYTANVLYAYTVFCNCRLNTMNSWLEWELNQ